MFDTDEPIFLCTDGSWEGTQRWIKAQDAKRYADLLQLGLKGSTDKLATLRKQIVRALNNLKLDEDLTSILKLLADEIGNNPRADVVRITDGRPVSEEDEVETEGFIVIHEDDDNDSDNE